MIRLLPALILLQVFVFPKGSAAAPASVHLYSLSIRLKPGTARALGLNYNLQFTTAGATEAFNGELTPLPDPAPSSHATNYRLDGDIFFEPVFGSLFVNLPGFFDQNENLVHDFFEVHQGFSATSSGVSDDLSGAGPATAVWNRAAGAQQGSLRLTLQNYALTFAHTFEIQEFSGTLDYPVSDSLIVGQVLVSSEPDRTKTLSGSVILDRINNDQARLRAGTWTNQAGQAVTHLGAEALVRDRSEYLDLLVFEDGDLSTGVEDYDVWILRIHDPNDADGDGIPDLTGRAAARRPSLAVGRFDQGLRLSITGEAGRTYQIEQITALGQTNWTQLATVTMTNETQNLVVTAPIEPASFWRVRVP